MSVTLRIFGVEIAKIDLDFEEEEQIKIGPVDKATKATSRWWVKRMVK